MIKHYDIVVLGAGAVGLTSALALTQIGYRVAVVATSPPHTDSTDPERAIALSHGSCQLLGQWGVWPAIEALGTGIIAHIEVCDPTGRGRVSIHHHELPVDALGQVVEMGHIIAPIWDAVVTSCGIFCPATVAALQQNDTHVCISLIHKNAPCQIQARLLVAADGSYSPTRRWAGIATKGWPHNRFAVVTSVSTAHGHHNTAYECFGHDGPLALLPMADGRLSLVWALAANEAMRLLQCPDTLFKASLTKALRATPARTLGAVSDIGKRGSFSLELRLAQQMAKGRVVLVGNAGHTIHPVAGQGMNLGFRDVADLSALLSRETARDDPAASVLLQQYAQQRRCDVSAVASFTEGLLATFAPNHALASMARIWAMRSMVAKTPWEKRMVQHATGIAQRKKS
ncbi:MAG: FAD-dependent monooxygenase [Mariprofundaceae bacterium]|nr:FAD-dependent monooxygenase [Mariprofundaceae bacterium]